MKQRFIAALLLAFVVSMVIPLHGVSHNVCVTGATPTGGCDSTYATIALALTNAVDSDVIYLHAATTYSGHWALPDKNMSTGITITSDTAVANLPPVGTRMTPAYSAFLPILHSDANTSPVFSSDQGADHYTLKALWFTNNPRGEGDVIDFGSNACDLGQRCDEFEANEASFMTADRILMTNAVITGQKRGISLGGKNLVIKNSYFTGFGVVGQDSQCFAGANGRGPVLIDNNYCDAAGEDFMFGGDDAVERTVMTVTGTPTTTSASVSVTVGDSSQSTATHNLSELAVGQKIAILTLSNTQRRYTHILSITGSGTTGSITFEPIPEVPDVPGDIRTGAIVNGVTITRNQFTKQLAWQSPILNAPASAVATWNVSAGSLIAGTYQYWVVAVNKSGNAGSTVSSSAIAAAPVTLTATGQAVIAWQAAPGATFYRVYGSHTSGTAVTMYFEVASTLLTYTDTGSAGTAATKLPTASKYSIKNLGELKCATNVLIAGNVFEYQWIGSDTFPAISFKSTNQGGKAEWCEVSNVVAENNIFRHVAGVLAVTGQESEDPVTGTRLGKNFPPPATNITFRNNLLYDSNSTWLLRNDGTLEQSKPAFNIQNHVINLKIDHNTVIHTMRAFVDLSCANTAKPFECQEDNLQITNNLGFANTYGIKGDTTGSGTSALTLFASSPYTVTANVIAGISTSQYPAGNFGPTTAALQAEFTNYDPTGADTALGPADFHLLTTSTYATAATDGTPIGANIDTILAATSGVTSGSVAPAAVAPSITTASLPHGTNGTAYSATLTGSGTGSLTWTKPSGTLPTGVSLSSGGVFSGTPSVTGTFSFTVRATDGTTGLTADQSLSIVIDQSFVAVSISTGATLTQGTVGAAYTVTITAADGLAPYTWSLASGSLPDGLSLDTTSTAITTTISGVPTLAGTYSFSLTVSGALGTSATKAFTLRAAAPASVAGRPSGAVNGITEGASFVRITCPTTTLVKKGDFCMDISALKAVPKFAESTNPVVWTAIGGSDNSHMFLSATHTDTLPETLVAGDTFVVDDNLKVRRLAKGADNTHLGTQGGTVGWYPDAQSTTTIINNVSSRPISLTFSTAINGNVSWNAAIGAGPTEFAGVSRGRLQFDLSQYSQARFEARVVTAGDAGTILYVQYSADGGTTWQALDGGTGPSVPIDASVSPTNLNVGSWVSLAGGAKADVLLRVVASGGSSSATPTFGVIALQLR